MILKKMGDKITADLSKKIDEVVEKKLIEHGVIYPPEDMIEGVKYFVYTSPETLFLKCMHCLNSVEAGERYVLMHYSEALKLDPTLSRWTRANVKMPHNCIGCEKNIEIGAEIVIFHEKCHGEMLDNARRIDRDKNS